MEPLAANTATKQAPASPTESQRDPVTKDGAETPAGATPLAAAKRLPQRVPVATKDVPPMP